jgi:hypothetical protein
MDFPSPTPRRVSKPRWLDVRLVFGVVLVLAAVLIGADVISSARHTAKELAVTHDLAAGTTLRAADIRTVDAQLPDTAHIYANDPAKAIGKVLDRPLVSGELVPSAVLGQPPARTTVSIPFAADAAPKLSRGERIVVWLSSKSCPTEVLLPDVPIQDVHAADAGTFASGGTGQDVVLSVAPDLAQRVEAALAIEDVSLRAGVLTGAAQPASSTPPALPALDTCGGSASP